MKKILWLLILLMPFMVLAYSDYIIPGGDTIGIEVNSEGVVIVGFYNVNGQKINRNLKIGDRIIEINGNKINSTGEINKLIENNIVGSSVDITYVRNDKEYNTKMELVYDNGNYKTGLYIKGSVLGIGTLTYIDPNSLVYGTLGHSLNFSQTNQKLIVSTGYSYAAFVTSFTRSVDGNPGTKNASIDKDDVIGNIMDNTNYGLFGFATKYNKGELLKVGKISDIKLGDAYIRTTNEDNEIVNYKIKILEIDKDNDDKNIYFEIVDEDLMDMSGGIVQGMSGSPIIQGDMIIGAVTRVLVDDVSKGYGISIVTMLEEGDKIIDR